MAAWAEGREGRIGLLRGAEMTGGVANVGVVFFRESKPMGECGRRRTRGRRSITKEGR
mgnify:CR=1 FL=1